MKIGVQGLNSGPAAQSGEATSRLARKADELGYDSWWTTDHVVLPSAPSGGWSGAAPETPILDAILELAYVAAVSERLLLATGVLVLPQRDPLIVAKQMATLDVLSGGRAVLGVGAGWLEPELNALGVPMSERGARMNEYLDVITEMWTSPVPGFRGTHVTVDGVDAHPRPTQPGGPRIFVGGSSPGAWRRAISRGHGWCGAGSLDHLPESLAGLAEAAETVERPARLGQLEITFMPLPAAVVDADLLRRLGDLGVTRTLVQLLDAPTTDEAERLLEAFAALPR